MVDPYRQTQKTIHELGLEYEHISWNVLTYPEKIRFWSVVQGTVIHIPPSHELKDKRIKDWWEAEQK